MSWTTIESDPGVFTDLLRAFGTRGVEIAELWGLDDDAFAPLGRVHGLLFLFKWGAKRPQSAGAGAGAAAPPPPVPDGAPAPWFARQVISNACATLALLHVVLNAREVDAGPSLRNFRDFTSTLGPAMAGTALEQAEDVRSAHNSFSRPEPFVAGAERAATDDDDVYHFIAYVPVGDVLWELDGLQPAPAVVSVLGPGEPWLPRAAAAIQARIAQAAEGEIRFNLMAVCDDAVATADARGGALVARARRLYTALLAAEGPAGAPAQAPDDLAAAAGVDIAAAGAAAAAATDARADAGAAGVEAAAPAALRAEYADVGAALAEAGAAAAAARARHAQWAVENARRRHNFVPLIMAALAAAADGGRLRDLYAAGQRRVAEARARALAAGGAGAAAAQNRG